MADKPNILIIMGDDIGWFNLSAVNHGVMGYQTPNIDRIASEGAMFTDAYGQQSCTAGRAAFITGQCPRRTGLLKIGMPHSPGGLSELDPTIGDLLQDEGYFCGQFGKNHVGDHDHQLPTVHGFDEFFGNLYHLNSEEEPWNVDFPSDPEFRAKYGPRGVLRSKSDGKGGQTVEDTGPLDPKRMETIDEEFLDASLDFMERAVADDRPFLCYFNSTRMHIFTHLKPESKGRTGLGVEADGMVEHDGHVGVLLDKLTELGIDDNTIVIYTTDNGAEKFGWPDGGTTPFRGEKATTWEGGFRIPLFIRWPGVIEPNQVNNDLTSLEDLVPTLLAAAGNTTVKEDLKKGRDANGKHFKVHLDGYNLLPALVEDGAEWPRKEFFYFVDDGTLGAVRYGRFKANLSGQVADGFSAWLDTQHPYKAPILIDLRSDPFEIAPDVGAGYTEWLVRRMYMFAPMKDIIAEFAETFKEFPPRQTVESFVPKQ
ncbi:MAG: arylsulfatase [Acidimicrobiales bacterium]